LIQVANAPVSYGAFEQTVGVLPNVPQSHVVLDAIAAAGYDGTELGPYAYFGTGEVLHDALERRGLQLAGAFVELDFRRGAFDELTATLDVLEPFGARPILSDNGPRDGDVDLDGVLRAVELARGRGFEPVVHHHMGTRVQSPQEIERLLTGTDVALLLDTGHLTAAGGDPVQVLKDWGDRVRHVHLKDVSLGVIGAATDWDDAWRNGAFCALGAGDVDLPGFFDALQSYDGWIVVEQDWFPRYGDDAAEHIDAQRRNREWLREHTGI
jgi:inosose dehydratase